MPLVDPVGYDKDTAVEQKQPLPISLRQPIRRKKKKKKNTGLA